MQVIQGCLGAIQPTPEEVTVSIIAHSVVIRHSTVLSVDEIAGSLDANGFEVHSIFQNDKAVYESPDVEIDAYKQSWSSRLEHAVSGWTTSSSDRNVDATRKKTLHLDQCEQCKIEQGGVLLNLDGRFAADLKTPLVSGEQPSIIETEETCTETSNPQTRYKATLTISGMTCSSCVSSITHTLKRLSYLKTANVNLLTSSAVVTFSEGDKIEEITNAVKECGFDANVESLEEVPSAVPTSQNSIKNNPDTWRAEFAIGGMTCGSCVSHIIKQFQPSTWVEQVDINLIGNSATFVFTGREHLAEIRDTIEDAGYTATLESIAAVGRAAEVSPARTISVRVDGMFCDHCPENVLRSIKDSFLGRVQLRGLPPSLKHPILTIEYLPQPPSFTVRHIFEAIENTHSEFNPSIHHPPTIEQKAKSMQLAERRRILRHLISCVIVAIPTFILGIVYMSLVPAHNSVRKYMAQSLVGNATRLSWALLILSIPVYVYSARSFHVRALREVRAMWRSGSRVPMWHRVTRFGSMNMLMSLGTTIAFFASIAELALAATKKTSGSMENSYFDAVVFLTMFLLIGRFLEALSKAKTGEAVASLGALRPDEAVLIDSTAGDVRISTDLLEIGDVVRVHQGTSPPFDGVILDGSSSFDESSLTGESRTVKKSVGDCVYSGTMNKGAPIRMEVTATSGTSMLDYIINAVREGQTCRAPVERVADTITAHFVPIVTLVATATWIVWVVLGTAGTVPTDWRDEDAGGWALWSLRFAIAVFVIACPCGIGLAAPTALFVGGGLAAKHGVLVRGGGEAFQEASSLDCIVFDKTGTLTQGGNPAVTAHEFVVNEQSRILTLRIVKALEQNSGHPIAQALVAFCNKESSTPLTIGSVDEIPGKGLKGTFDVNGDVVTAIVGNESLMADYHVAIPLATTSILEIWKARGESVALTALRSASTQNSWQVSCLFAISDPLRPEAASVISALMSRGIDVWMLSGDNPTTANAVGAQVGIAPTNIIAGVLPDEKAKKIEFLQNTLVKRRKTTLFRLPAVLQRKRSVKRATIAMVGDGINDAPALSTADLSIAIGSGSDIALSSSSFILINSQLTTILTLLDLSRVVFRRVYFNFGWATVYNLLAMPIAAGVLYPITTGGGTDEHGMQTAGQHVRLDPVWASLAMALSSISVVCSSLALRSRVPLVGFRVRKEEEELRDEEVENVVGNIV